MGAALHSDRWYKIRGLRPRLVPSARFRRQRVRGEIWYLVSGGGAGAAQRINQEAWAFVGRCDGRRTVDQIWAAMSAADAERTPTQDEVIGLVIQLHGQDLIDFDGIPDIAALDRRRARRQRKSERSRLNPLSFRVPLGSPGRLLDRTGRLKDHLFSPASLACWVVLVVAGLLTWIAHWDEAADYAGRWLASPRYLLIAWLCYPAIKLIHEAAHALAIRRWGGDVHEVGLALLFLTPLPYVDASEATLLPRRYQRCMVSAAGIAAELAIAAAAMIAWAALEPGLLRDIMFSVALTGSLSTLLFNANPLMRLDGYYVMCDLLQLPNLASRSSAWWRDALVRRGLGVSGRQTLRTGRTERRWLIAYLPLSWGYRLIASCWLVLWAGANHPMLGLLAALMMGVMVVVIPLGQGVRGLLQAVPPDRRRHMARLRLGAGIMAVLVLLLAVPLPDRLLVQGVIWVPDEGHLRVATAGFLGSVVPDGTLVDAGEPVAELTAPEVETELQRQLERRQGLRTAVYRSLIEDPYRSRQLHDELTGLDEQIRLLQERHADLAMRAGMSGRLTLARPQDLPGRYLARGSELGLIQTGATTVVRVAMVQEDAARLAQAVSPPMLQRVWNGGEPVPGQIRRLHPAASDRLPSAALSSAAGGDLVTDPTDSEHLKVQRPVRLVDIEAPVDSEGAAGSRVWVRFDLGYRPLAAQVLRFARQQLLVRFSPVET